MAQILDTDYIYAVTLIRIWEKKLIPAQMFQKLYEQGTLEEVMMAAREAGYDTDLAYDEMLSKEMQKTYASLKQIAPKQQVFDLFLIQNDYHNLKVLMREAVLNRLMDSLLLSNARYDVAVLKEAIKQQKFENMSEQIKMAYQEGSETLAASHDPQRMDMVVDRYMYEDLLKEAAAVGNEFLMHLFRTEVDLTNLKIMFRLENRRKDKAFYEKALIDGGTIDKGVLLELSPHSAESILDFYRQTVYRTIVQEASNIAQIDIRCDHYIQSLMTKANNINFGLEPLVAYLLKKQSEIEKLRVLLVAKRNHITSNIVAERLGMTRA